MLIVKGVRGVRGAWLFWDNHSYLCYYINGELLLTAGVALEMGFINAFPIFFFLLPNIMVADIKPIGCVRDCTT